MPNPDAPPLTKVVVLAVSPDQADLCALRDIISHSNWQLNTVRTVEETASYLDRNEVPVILCDSKLPDGTWKDVFNAAVCMGNPPNLVVISRHADDKLWAEVLNWGGYDVLPIPFDAAEVFRVVSLAWRHWRNELQSNKTRPLASRKRALRMAG